MKKTTWFIGAILFAIAITVIIYRGLEYNHFDHDLLQVIIGLILILFFVGFTTVSIMVAWEQGNFYWLIPLGFTYMDMMSGSSSGLILALVVPTLFVIVRYRSWKSVFRKITC